MAVASGPEARALAGSDLQLRAAEDRHALPGRARTRARNQRLYVRVCVRARALRARFVLACTAKAIGDQTVEATKSNVSLGKEISNLQVPVWWFTPVRVSRQRVVKCRQVLSCVPPLWWCRVCPPLVGKCCQVLSSVPLPTFFEFAPTFADNRMTTASGDPLPHTCARTHPRTHAPTRPRAHVPTHPRTHAHTHNHTHGRSRSRISTSMRRSSPRARIARRPSLLVCFCVGGVERGMRMHSLHTCA